MSLAVINHHDQQFSLNDVRYFVHPHPLAVLSGHTDALIPPFTICTVVNLTPIEYKTSNAIVDTIRRRLQSFEKTDDVYTPAWLESSLILLMIDEECLHKVDLTFISKEIGRPVSVFSSNNILPLPHWISRFEGPFVIQGSFIQAVYRLYADDYHSFVCGVVPDMHDGYRVLSIADPINQNRSIAVPSRLYAPASIDKPLAGVRLTVKDNYLLKGVKTTLGSKAYARLYGPAMETARMVKEYVNLGAVVIGKTKLCGFAVAEFVPVGTIDHLPPFNCRADGYQSPSGSSMGPACSLAAHEWVDLSLGTDSMGSIRLPARDIGLFGMRTTCDPSLMEGCLIDIPMYNTPGLLHRTLDGLLPCLNVIENPRAAPNKWRIVFPPEYHVEDREPYRALVDLFVKAVESAMDQSVETWSFSELWNKTSGTEQTMNGWSKSIDLMHYRNEKVFLDKFCREYEEKFGEHPYFSPHVWFRLTNAEKCSPAQSVAAADHIMQFRSWCEKEIFRDDTIVIAPINEPYPFYRDEIEHPEIPSSVTSIRLASRAGVPVLVLPIGQHPYTSKITGNVEYTPAAVSLMGPAGSDKALIEFARDVLTHAGWPLEVLTGKTVFPVAEDNMLYSKHGSLCDRK